MNSDRHLNVRGTTQEPRLVSGRFVSDFLRALERQGIPVNGLLGDLPILRVEGGQVRGSVEWNHFVEFMRRLENSVGGAAGLEACGTTIGVVAPAAALTGLVGHAASPHALYRAASQWALRRALPGLETQLRPIDDGHLEIDARFAEGSRPCPQLFHLATGGARVLPRLIGLGDAVVSTSIGEDSAQYRIAVPPSRSLFARCKRLYRTIFSAGRALHYLEAQQLELHAKNEELQRANEALAESDRRYRAITDTAVDVLCEIDESGHVVYVSRSIQDLIGYSPEQVTGSHFRLWVAQDLHDRVTEAFDCLVSLPQGRANQDLIRLHNGPGEQITAEMTARTYDMLEGQRRIVCILRKVRARTSESAAQSQSAIGNSVNEHPPTPAHEATRLMTRVVESALIQSSDSSPRMRWIETRKLIGALRDEFFARNDAVDINLQIDLADAPPEIWTKKVLLETGLTSLLDWATHSLRARKPYPPTPTIRLRVETTTDTSPRDGVVLCVATEHAGPVGSPGAELALEIAADAAITLGGRLSGDDRIGGSHRCIHLPQPLQCPEQTHAGRR